MTSPKYLVLIYFQNNLYSLSNYYKWFGSKSKQNILGTNHSTINIIWLENKNWLHVIYCYVCTKYLEEFLSRYLNRKAILAKMPKKFICDICKLSQAQLSQAEHFFKLLLFSHICSFFRLTSKILDRIKRAIFENSKSP